MPFKDVPTTIDFVSQEHRVLQLWEEINAFDKLRSLRRGGPRFSFVDGPITANNPMGAHGPFSAIQSDAGL